MFAGAVSLLPFGSQKSTAGFYLKRKLIVAEGTDLSQAILQTQTYINYKKLFALDKEFQQKQLLLSLNMEKGEGYSLVTRQFASSEARAYWMERFDAKVLSKPEQIKYYGHRYEVALENV